MVTLNDLFYLDPVGNVAFRIDASPQVSCPSIMSTPSSNEIEGESIAAIFVVLAVNEAMDDRGDPFVPFDALIKVTNQEVIPHHLALPRLVLLQLPILLLRVTGLFSSLHLVVVLREIGRWIALLLRVDICCIDII